MIAYDVRVWQITPHRRAKGRTYEVRWSVAGSRKSKSFKTRALAEAFRAKLLTAAREGEPFDQASGLPTSTARARPSQERWYDHACAFVDMKWKDSAAKSRRNRAEALTLVTMALLPQNAGRPDEATFRRVLINWAFNTALRNAEKPIEVSTALRWTRDNSPPVSVLADPDVLRGVLDAIGSKLDGTAAAPATVNRRRADLSATINYAIERGLLPANPLKTLKSNRTKYRSRGIVDRRSVVNPAQARRLLQTVATTGRSGTRLVAFFALLYYAALRPEEATNIRRTHLDVPDHGWGTIYLERVTPDAGTAWTDSGHRHDDRPLKHRADGDVRAVPCPPELTMILHQHLDSFGTRSDGRLFSGERGGPLPGVTYRTAWSAARRLALTAKQVASPLAKRPYDLRHAAVSTWLNAGIPPAQVAEWAGHSVEVLLRVYAACLDSQENQARKRIEEALRQEEEDDQV